MRIGEICIRDVVCVDRTTTVQEAARLMRSHHVGNVLIVDTGVSGRTPLGIVTDRDIVVSVVAAAIEPAHVSVGDIMDRHLITISEDQGIFETVEQIERHGVRRLPVVDKAGSLVGIVSLDDMQELFAMQLSQLSKAIGRERRKEVETRL